MILLNPRSLFLAVLLLTVNACSTLDDLAVGRTDRLRPGQFYMTYDEVRMPGPSARIGLLPVTVQPNLDEPDLAYRTGNPALSLVAAEIAAKLAGMQETVSIAGPSALTGDGAAGVYIGSSAGDNVPMEAGIGQEPFEKYPPMVAYLKKGSDAYNREISRLADEFEVDHIIRVWISVAQYPKADKGMFGKKVVLGTHHEEDIRFLSALDKPVEVLQVSGYLVDRNGVVVRAGAEGLVFSDTPFWVQVLELERVMGDEDIVRALNESVRKDLPGQPLVVDVALRNLMSQLTNRHL